MKPQHITLVFVLISWREQGNFMQMRRPRHYRVGNVGTASRAFVKTVCFNHQQHRRSHRCRHEDAFLVWCRTKAMYRKNDDVITCQIRSASIGESRRFGHCDHRLNEPTSGCAVVKWLLRYDDSHRRQVDYLTQLCLAEADYKGCHDYGDWWGFFTQYVVLWVDCADTTHNHDIRIFTCNDGNIRLDK